MSEFVPFHVDAANLPEHARNVIHTDVGAQAAGFTRALVAGVTTYAYLTHPIAAAWGLHWLGNGGATLSLRSPVFAGDALVCGPAGDDRVVASVDGLDDVRAEVRATNATAAPFEVPPVQQLRALEVELSGRLGSDYGRPAGDDLSLYHDHEVVHPAVWPELANSVVHSQVAGGAWVHTGSTIRHHALVSVGATAVVRGAIIERRSTRRGELATMRFIIEVDGNPVASLEHAALVRLGRG
jgi:acyl dehydratase